MAHRGAPAHAPENSLRGFALAAKLGATMVETDVRATSDGILLLAHDDTLDGPRGVKVQISRTRWAALHSRGGHRPATLHDALGLRHHGAPLHFNLDIKAPGMALTLVEALRTTGRHDGILLTGHAAPTFAAVRAQQPWVQAALTRAATRRTLPSRRLARLAPQRGGLLLGQRLVLAARAAGVDALTVEYTLASTQAVRACHRAGLRVLVWTVDDPALMRALRASGVDGITTNRIDLLVALDQANCGR